MCRSIGQGGLILVEERAVVFVVDDDPSMRLALEDLISTVGLKVRAFAAPQEFLLALSEMTMKIHRGQVTRKMRAGSLPELVRMADQLGEPTASF